MRAARSWATSPASSSSSSIRDDRRLLGVHIVGEGAAELVHVGVMVLQAGGTIDAFIDAVFNYPSLGEAYKYAAYDGLGALARMSR